MPTMVTSQQKARALAARHTAKAVRAACPHFTVAEQRALVLKFLAGCKF